MGSGRRSARPVLVVGPQRSGTTWTAQVLGATPGAELVIEPDNFDASAFALRAMIGLGSYPVFGPHDRPRRAYRRLWAAAFGSPVRRLPGPNRIAFYAFGRTTRRERGAAIDLAAPEWSGLVRLVAALARPPRQWRVTSRRVVKSVYVALALDWVVAAFDPVVLVVRRHPLDVVASRLALGSLLRGGDQIAPTARLARAERWGAAVP